MRNGADSFSPVLRLMLGLVRSDAPELTAKQLAIFLTVYRESDM